MSSPSALGGPEAVDAARASAAARRRSGRAALARCRTARAPRRRTSGARGSPGTCPSAPRRVKKNVQSMYGTSSRERHVVEHARARGTRAAATSSARQSSCRRLRARLGERQQRLARCRVRAARAARSCSSRFVGVEAGALRRDRAGSTRRRPRARRRARARSRRCTRARSSPRCAAGSSSRRRSAAAASMPRRSISRATCTISSSDGVIRPDRPMMSACSLDRRSSRILSPGTITPRSMTS